MQLRHRLPLSVKATAGFLAAMLIGLALAACQPADEPEGLVLEAGWVRAMPPGKGMTAAYGALTNWQSDTVIVRSFASDQFADVSLHRTIVEDGISRMRAVESLSLEPGQTVLLEPGGLHLMLMGPSGSFSPGDRVSLGFITADGARFDFAVPVEQR